MWPDVLLLVSDSTYAVPTMPEPVKYSLSISLFLPTYAHSLFSQRMVQKTVAIFWGDLTLDISVLPTKTIAQ